jgi:xylulokinase
MVDVLELSHRLVKANRAYVPDPRNKENYDRSYSVFKKLYKDNASNFRAMNA